MAGRFEEAREHILASSPLLDQPVQTDFSLQSRWTIADAMECAGDLAGAEQKLRPSFLSMRDARGAGPEARALRIAAQLALLLCDQGRWDEAAAYLAYGEEVDGAEPVQGKIYSWYRFAARGRLAAQRGELDRSARARPPGGRGRRSWRPSEPQGPRLALTRRGNPSRRTDGRGRRRRRDGARALRTERERRRRRPPAGRSARRRPEDFDLTASLR